MTVRINLFSIPQVGPEYGIVVGRHPYGEFIEVDGCFWVSDASQRMTDVVHISRTMVVSPRRPFWDSYPGILAIWTAFSMTGSVPVTPEVGIHHLLRDMRTLPEVEVAINLSLRLS